MRVPPRKYVRKMRGILQFARNICKKNGLHLLHPISITPLSSELEWGYAYCMQIDNLSFFENYARFLANVHFL